MGKDELVPTRTPWWRPVFPGALALACHITLETTRGDPWLWGLYYAQFALVLIGLGMAFLLPNLHPTARALWAIAYLAAAIPTGFFVLLDSQCRFYGNCI